MKTSTILLIGTGILLLGGIAVVTSNYPQWVLDFANAVAVAERGKEEISSGNIVRNNPGDIENAAGQLNVYQTITDGWNALYHQINLMFSGSSQVYTPNMTIEQVAYLYADGQHDPTGASNWAANVASQLGVTPDTTLSEIMSSYQG